MKHASHDKYILNTSSRLPAYMGHNGDTVTIEEETVDSRGNKMYRVQSTYDDWSGHVYAHELKPLCGACRLQGKP